MSMVSCIHVELGEDWDFECANCVRVEAEERAYWERQYKAGNLTPSRPASEGAPVGGNCTDCLHPILETDTLYKELGTCSQYCNSCVEVA